MSTAAAAHGAWNVESHTGAASSFHARSLPDDVTRAVWLFTVDRPALVLGSAQPLDTVDDEAMSRSGYELVRRRSGGGAVLVAPGDLTWIDVIIPSDDPLWEVDVGRAFRWLGVAWAEALSALGVAPLEIHRGPLVRSPWSGLVCFAGLGPGEICVDGHKVLGISQRRNRVGARFQCALLHRWAPESLVGVLHLDPAERRRATADLCDVTAGLDQLGWRFSSAEVVEALTSTLPH